MSKSVLVMDTPEGCYHCKFWYFGLSGTDYCLMFRENKKIENIDIHTEKPDWCPLIPLERRESGEVLPYVVGEPITDEIIEKAIDFGFNECIDEIEIKEEEKKNE